jgi:peroxiredoxin
MVFRLRAFPLHFICLAAAAAFLAGCSRAPQTAKASDMTAVSDRTAAPDFSLKDAKGATVHLADYKGRVVVLDFWATWCGPCKIEIPWFMEFQQQFKDRGFSVVGVSMDEGGWDDVKPFIEQHKINYPILLGNDTVDQSYSKLLATLRHMKVDQANGLESLPTTFLIDRSGRIAAVHEGVEKGKDELRDEIDHLLTAESTRVIAPTAAIFAGPK